MVEGHPQLVNQPFETDRFKVLLYDIPAKLYEELGKSNDVLGTYFCSPWLSDLEIPGFMQLLHSKIKNRPFEILTRPPLNEDKWHKETLNILHKECGAKIFINPVLHAKMYIIIAKNGSFAVFGSPNLTRNARTNIEVALITYDKPFIDHLFNIFQIHIKVACKYWR